ncbi:hypothetical protein FEM48_Zijuj08G0083500 [Ziziphus jujuba var. spinosa]|uniref:Pentatricopeptide repeat-containing protein n=1 Tax=Ziziphus jujuba var. spinosa TaxID=714518 RepID=A0A978UY08_ZIZJJ|nr:hypothetical protein FEM48_Zijuj08G0083500 [Ziziphus jujuba var. spinosa]
MHGLFGRCAELLVSRRKWDTLGSFPFLFAARICTGHHCRDSYDYTYLLEQCKSKKSVKKVHAQIVIGGYEQNPFVAAKLVGKYVEYDSNMEVASKVFDSLLDRDVFVWNMVIQGYANLGPFEEALDLYHQMRLSGLSANRYTYPFVLKACGAMKDGNKDFHHIGKIGQDNGRRNSNSLTTPLWPQIRRMAQMLSLKFAT